MENLMKILCSLTILHKFYKQPISKQVAIIKGCAISNTGVFGAKTLIEGEPKLF